MNDYRFIYEDMKRQLVSKKLTKVLKTRLLLACQKYAYDNQLYEDLGDMKNVSTRNNKPK